MDIGAGAVTCMGGSPGSPIYLLGCPGWTYSNKSAGYPWTGLALDHLASYPGLYHGTWLISWPRIHALHPICPSCRHPTCLVPDTPRILAQEISLDPRTKEREIHRHTHMIPAQPLLCALCPALTLRTLLSPYSAHSAEPLLCALFTQSTCPSLVPSYSGTG